MKTYSKKQIIKQIIISAVIALITFIALMVSGLWSFSDSSIGYTIIMAVAIFTLFPIGFMSFFYIDWKRAIIGMIAPIPVLSYVICCCKGMFFTFCALFSLIRGKEEYTFNKYGVEKAE